MSKTGAAIAATVLGAVAVMAAVTESADSTPVEQAGNPRCADYGLAELHRDVQPGTPGVGDFTFVWQTDNTVKTYGPSSFWVIVKGGPGAYLWGPDWQGYIWGHAPTNPGGNRPEISHLDVCSDTDPTPTTTTSTTTTTTAAPTTTTSPSSPPPSSPLSGGGPPATTTTGPASPPPASQPPASPDGGGGGPLPTTPPPVPVVAEPRFTG